MPRLTQEEQNEFLATPGILMRIACVRPDGSPLVTPIWFIHHDGAICFTPRAQSEWFACLKHDPRVSLCIDEQNLPYRKVIVEGSAELVHDLGNDDAWRDLYRDIARRYVPPDAAEAYVHNTIDQERALYRLPLDEATVKSWRMPVEGEDQTGIWHQRYYAAGTKFSKTGDTKD
ncbi:MAG: pyridoxamine 5'-phosphate oxidase family protein [Pseudomonadales bacterium]|jgi:nitroimidazol reductase NimA-like FMN-containing flavoprotein (pyridoxamine 5'-phosphate oxidase superfamily)|nr:pyridoxamine 5'-phosphate oxidase family protein [Pseudomonadales bacterium]